MKVVLLCGGRGTRLSEETEKVPKPLVEIGDKPILWHIMKYYSMFGFNDFIICAGYKAHLIKEFFSCYWQHNSDICINTATNTVKLLKPPDENWNVSIIDTGLDTCTGGRLLKIKEYIDDTFLMTYGDGISDIDLTRLLDFHIAHGKVATVTGIKITGRFGVLSISGDTVNEFIEKPNHVNSWISGGFFVFSPKIFDYIKDDVMLEREPLEGVSRDKQLTVYKHSGSWQCMDTLRDKITLDTMWKEGKAFWKIW